MVNKNRLFVGSIIALVATSFGFVIRAGLLFEWGTEFNLSGVELGWITGAGVLGFPLTIILFSLIIDKIGYHTSIRIACAGHVLSALVTICAGHIGDPFWVLYIGTFILALANGIVEAVINPAVATLYPESKTHHLNILHAGWPGGLVLGGVLLIAVGDIGWRWQVAFVILPTLVYGWMLVRETWPVQERVAAGVGYGGMLRTMYHPLFLILLVIMVPLAITELGTDSWITALMTSVLSDTPVHPLWVLVYTSAIMFVLRFFAGPIVHRINPLGLLACSAGTACIGLVLLSQAGSVLWYVFLAATCYGLGKTFFWPTTLGVVSEQFPQGGAMTINTIAGVGMLAAGALGGPIIGAIQDNSITNQVQGQVTELSDEILGEERTALLVIPYRPLNDDAVAMLPEEDQERVVAVQSTASQLALKTVAWFPAFMFVSYILLILYFRSKGGYKVVELKMEEETGGVEGPAEF